MMHADFTLAFSVPWSRPDERKLLEFAHTNVAHFKAPHRVTFVKELPKTATGKIQKYILRAQRPAIAPQ
jgi:fatty-acyl-CoA synthase